MENWDDAAQVFNMSLHYDGDYRLIVSPFTFGKVNTSNDREDMVGRALDWLRASAAADDVGVKVLKLESDAKENSTISFSSIIKNYGSDTQAAIDVKATILDSQENEVWTNNQQITGPLESGEEETLEWEWESNNPGEYIIIVETTKEDENHRNDDKEIDLDVEMIETIRNGQLLPRNMFSNEENYIISIENNIVAIYKPFNEEYYKPEKVLV